MEKWDLHVKKYTEEYYHMERKSDYVDSGDPDLIETDPFDDKLLQFFIKNITKKETFDCLIPLEEFKLFSRIAGKPNAKEDRPISLINNDLILLRCSLYY